jgi:LacI family transcriptional regulator
MSPDPGKTIVDVAREAQVSVSTVSRVLRGVLPVLPDTRERVFAAAAKVGYQPNAMARALRTGKSNTIGLILTPSALCGTLFPEAIATLQSILSPRGMQLTITLADDKSGADAALRTLSGWCAAVAIQTDTLLANMAVVPAGIPVLLIGRASAETAALPDASRIGFDETDAVKQLVEHLVGLGHRNIAFIGAGPADVREAGFRRGMQEAGLPMRQEWMVDFGAGDILDSAQSIWRQFSDGSRSRLTAMVCPSDEIARAMIFAVRQAGMDVPHHYSVVGYGNQIASQNAYPRITTVEHSGHELGVALGELITECAVKPSRPAKNVLIPAKLILRTSTAPRTASAHTSSAIQAASEWPEKPDDSSVLLADGVYEIEACHSKMMMEVPYCVRGPGGALWQWTSNGFLSQLWHIEQVDGNWYTIRNMGNWMYVDSNPELPDITPTIIHPFRDDAPDTQLWAFKCVDRSQGVFHISNKAKALALDVAHELLVPNAAVIVFPYKASENQHWRVRPIPFITRDCELVASHSSRALDVREGSRAPGSVPCQNGRSRSLGQRWRLIHKGRALYVIQSKLSNLNLQASRVPGSNVILAPEDPEAIEAQLWKVELADANQPSWKFVNQATGQVLEVHDGYHTDEAVAKAGDWTGGAHQQWLVYEDETS